MSMRIGRRWFMLSAAFAALSLYLGSWWLFSVRKGRTAAIAAAIIHKRLSYLDLDEADVVRFAKDLEQAMRPEFRRPASWAGMLAPIYAFVNVFALSPRSREFRLFEEYVVGKFLMSTDFFWQGAEIARPVRYLVFHDPYRAPCVNPFARLG